MGRTILSVAQVHQKIATHIPLLSAFGVPVTRNNYGGTNLYWAMQSGPFDKIHFQPTNYDDKDIIPLSKANNGNQIHMTITNDTKEYLKDQMEQNIDNIVLPHYYSEELLAEPIIQNITGDVAYNAKSTIEFSSIYQNPSAFIIESGANVTSTAGESITLKAGFHAKNGASFSAKIENNSGGRKSNTIVSPTNSINYSNTSNYVNGKHTHASLVKNNKVQANVENSVTSLFSVYPTMSNGIYKIANKEVGLYNIEVINSLGHAVINSSQNINQIDITDKNAGFYFVRITYENKTYVYKIIKE